MSNNTPHCPSPAQRFSSSNNSRFVQYNTLFSPLTVMRIGALTLSFLVLAAPGLADADGRTSAEAAADGNRLLAKGSYSDAARAYTEAIGAWSSPKPTSN